MWRKGMGGGSRWCWLAYLVLLELLQATKDVVGGETKGIEGGKRGKGVRGRGQRETRIVCLPMGESREGIGGQGKDMEQVKGGEEKA